MNGSGVVHRFHTVTASPGRANVLRLAATGRPRGDYRVRLTASRGGELVSAALVSRRL